jgi:RES domain-containing protein
LSAQKLRTGVTGYRIGDPDGDHPIYDATGSRLYPGRWNTPASPMIYASEHYGCAMLEKLVHGSGSLPPNQHFIEITIQAGSSYEVFSEPHHPGWDTADQATSKAFGEQWVLEGRSLILFVPSVVARMERNILINAAHPEAATIEVSRHTPVWWDSRLFSP